jgi:hypothetical protein
MAGIGPAITDVTAVVTPVLIIFLVSNEEHPVKVTKLINNNKAFMNLFMCLTVYKPHKV